MLIWADRLQFSSLDPVMPGRKAIQPGRPVFISPPSDADRLELRFGWGKRPPSAREEQIIQDFFRENPLSDAQIRENEKALADFGFPDESQRLLRHLARPVFMESKEVQALKPSAEEKAGPEPVRHYLNRVLGTDAWYKPGQEDFFSPKPLFEVVTNAIVLQSLFPRGQWKRYPSLLLMDPLKVYARVLNFDEIFGSRENWRLGPGLLSCTVERIRQKAVNLDLHFGEAWKSIPELLIPSTSTIDRNVFLLKFLGCKLGTDVRLSSLQRSTQVLSRILERALAQYGCPLPQGLRLPTTPQQLRLFKSYLQRNPSFARKFNQALIPIQNRRLFWAYVGKG